MTSSRISPGTQPAENSASPPRLKLLVVSRLFWPHSNLTELAIADLAWRLKQQGHEVIVVSSRGTKQWTERIRFRGIPVSRIARPATGPWSSYRYVRTFTRFIGEQTGLNAAIVSGLGDEALATTRVCAGKIPVLIRVDNSLEGVGGSLHRRHVEISQSATRVVCNCEIVAEQISRVPGMPQPAVIRDGVTVCDRQGGLASQSAARTALSDAHPVLHIDLTQRLVISGIPVGADRGAIDLVDSWSRVLANFRGAKLWLLGNGHLAPRIWERIVERNLVHSVIMPGYFDNLDDVFTAADLYVHPGRSESSCGFLPRAMAAGVAPVVTDSPWARTIIKPDHNALVVPRQSPLALAEAIIHGLNNSDLRVSLAGQAQATVGKIYCPQRQIQKYLKLLRVNAPSVCKIKS